jgi:uncharacterized protein YlxP (DUF503 family)
VVLAARYVLRLPGCHTLKDKRARLRPLVDRVRHRHVSVAEVACQDVHDRAELELAVAAPGPARAEELMDELDRLVWSVADLEVVETTRAWVEGLD